MPRDLAQWLFAVFAGLLRFFLFKVIGGIRHLPGNKDLQCNHMGMIFSEQTN